MASKTLTLPLPQSSLRNSPHLIGQTPAYSADVPKIFRLRKFFSTSSGLAVVEDCNLSIPSLLLFLFRFSRVVEGPSVCRASLEPSISSSGLAGPLLCARALSTPFTMFSAATNSLLVGWLLHSSGQSLMSTLVCSGAIRDDCYLSFC